MSKLKKNKVHTDVTVIKKGRKYVSLQLLITKELTKSLKSLKGAHEAL